MSTPISLSRNNRLVLDRLIASDCPLSAYALLDALRDEGLRAPPQIYRALKWLGERGLVHKLESANAYVACAHASCCGAQACATSHTIFFLCDACGSVEEVNGATIAKEVDDLASSMKFVARATSLEVHGQCVRCQAA
ncbi:MAG: transcriptional repressor [Devosiaceae bacterium]